MSLLHSTNTHKLRNAILEHDPAGKGFQFCKLFETKGAQIGQEFLNQFEVSRAQINGVGKKELLGHPEPIFQTVERLFIQDAFMGRILIYDHQPRTNLGKDVAVVELP